LDQKNGLHVAAYYTISAAIPASLIQQEATDSSFSAC